MMRAHWCFPLPPACSDLTLRPAQHSGPAELSQAGYASAVKGNTISQSCQCSASCNSSALPEHVWAALLVLLKHQNSAAARTQQTAVHQ